MKKSNEDVKTNASKKKGRGEQRDFPVLPFPFALEVAKAIDEKLGGKVLSYDGLSTALHVKGGALIQRIAASRRYGLIEGKGEMKPTPLAMKIMHPINEGEDVQGAKEAIFNVPLFKELIERFGGKLPENEILRNVLQREYGVPKAVLPRVANAIRRNIELLEAGKTYMATDVEAEPMNAASIHPVSVGSRGESPQLTISFRGDMLKLDISTEEDWAFVDIVIKTLKAKWLSYEQHKADMEEAHRQEIEEAEAAEKEFKEGETK